MWSIPVREPVVIPVYDSVHYDVDSEDATEEFARLLPSGGHLVHLGVDLTTYTVSMLHQLRCLSIIGEAHNSPLGNRSSDLPEHCVNYLRQMLLCQPNLHLEFATTVGGRQTRTGKPYEAVCYDWTAIYDAAEENNESYLSRLGLATVSLEVSHCV